MEREITLHYKSNRAEVWRWYWRSWAMLNGLWRYHALFFTLGAGLILQMLANRHALSPTDLGWSALAGLAVVAGFVLWPQIAFKADERTLTLDSAGFRTCIGKLNGEVPWTDIKSVERDDQTINITRKNLRAMLVPRRAFNSDAEREQIYQQLQVWFRAANSA